MKPTEQKTMLDFLNEVSIEKGYRNWYDVYSREHYSECNRIPQESGRRYAQWAISQMQPGWVSVTERLPLEGQEVNVSFEHLVYHQDHEVIESGVTTATFSTHELLRPVFCKANGYVVLCVTHWSELPQPPKETTK